MSEQHDQHSERFSTVACVVYTTEVMFEILSRR